ncbi:hypothetical protein HYFRA_00009646 [Hymenoscyphus fraxineus]|uniref:Uncharacterized protein n=1 Tax=Hymenoscyphus fraxineus TaxID=746836 RepID=A0A9N9KW16_9HELO|nr:hypothetical protein HYFRA_00009646 [Hymenoscyphus fraxineus]
MSYLHTRHIFNFQYVRHHYHPGNMAPIDKTNYDYLDWLDVIHPKIERSSPDGVAKDHSPKVEPRDLCKQLVNINVIELPLHCILGDALDFEKINTTPAGTVEKRSTWDKSRANAWQRAKSHFTSFHPGTKVPKTGNKDAVIRPRFLWWGGKEEVVEGKMVEDDDRPLPVRMRDSENETEFSNIALHAIPMESETTNLTHPVMSLNATDKKTAHGAHFPGFHFREAQDVGGQIPIGVPNHTFLFKNTGVDRFLGGAVLGTFVFFGIKLAWENLREPRKRV